MYDCNHKKWQANEDDNRKIHEVAVDFTIGCIELETAPLRHAIDTTNHLLTVLLADPLVHKDQKEYIQKRLEINRKLLQSYELEVVNA